MTHEAISHETVARELLAAARSLVEHPDARTRGVWPRAAVLLARQSLEIALATYWSAASPGLEVSPMRAQLLCLGPWLGDEPLARRAHLAWSALSRASHHHPYELTPTQEELAAWCETVYEVIEVTERRWRTAR